MLAIQGGVWLSSISCDVNYRSGRHGFGDSWNLGRIEHGSIDRVRERLNEMADRRKISSDRAAYVDDWIKLLAERTEALPTIKITRQ